MGFNKSTIESQLSDATSVLSDPMIAQIAEAKGLFSPQAPQQNLVVGTVLYSLPSLNTYYVMPANNVGTTKDGMSLSVVATSTGGNSLKYGVSCYTVYQPGTQVLMTYTNVDPVPGTLDAPPAYTIIGTMVTEGLLESEAYPPVDVWYNDGLDYYATTYAAALAANKSDALTDKSYGAPLNLFHGDDLKAGDFDNFVAVTASGVNLGSLKARIDMNALTDTLRIYADNYQREAPYLESGARLDMDNSLVYTKTAYSVLEGLGAIKGKPFKKDDNESYIPTEEEQQGFFRDTEYKGKLVGVSWYTNQLPPDVDVFTRAPEKLPFGVYSQEQPVEGTVSRRAAGELAAVKSPFVPVPVEMKDELAAEEPLPEDADPGKTWADEEGIAEEDYPHVSPANFADEYDYNTAEHWRARMRGREDYWKIPTAGDLKETAGVDLDKARREIEPLDEADYEYELPDQIKIKDPVSGEERLYYAAESFIRQMPDGSISISDGYGSEIRMVKGRIIISAATDIEYRAGRDIVNMAARHNVTIGGDSVFVHASNGDLYMKSEKNMNIMAGNGDEGQLTLESRSTEQSTKNKVGNGRGIIIKSDTDLGISGKNIYMGLYDDQDKSTSGLSRSQSGTFILDSCKSTLGLMGEYVYANAKQSASFVCGSGAGSALSLGPGKALLAGQSVQLGCGNCVVNSMSGDATVHTLGSSGLTPAPITASGSATLTVKGSIKSTASIYCSNSMMASNMTATHGSFGGASKHFSHAGGGSPPAVQIPSITGDSIKEPSEDLKSQYDKTTQDSDLLTGSAYSLSKLAYPSSEDLRLSSDYKIWAARWQNMLQNPELWAEPPVKDENDEDTFIYPGDLWRESIYFSGKGESGDAPESFLPINSKQTED